MCENWSVEGWDRCDHVRSYSWVTPEPCKNEAILNNSPCSHPFCYNPVRCLSSFATVVHEFWNLTVSLQNSRWSDNAVQIFTISCSHFILENAGWSSSPRKLKGNEWANDEGERRRGLIPRHVREGNDVWRKKMSRVPVRNYCMF